MPETIVPGALFGVAEDGIRLRGLLEPILGGLVAGIAVGVVLQRQLSVGALDFLLAGAAADAQHLVVIPTAHALATLTIAGRSRR